MNSKHKRNTLKRSLRTAFQSGVTGIPAAVITYLAAGDWWAAGAIAIVTVATPVISALQNWAENKGRGGTVEED